MPQFNQLFSCCGLKGVFTLAFRETVCRMRTPITWGVALWAPITLVCGFSYRSYYVGAENPEHCDYPAESLRGATGCLVLRPADEGGELVFDRGYLNLPYLKVFNNSFPHSVSPVRRGTRTVLLLNLYWGGPYSRPLFEPD
jgi:hypothetical protein